MARMTLDQLQIFLAVAQHLHFTRAADALYISQPAVSVAIQSLEKQYQVKLFHRIEPTELNVIVEMKSGAMVKAAVARGVAAAAISEMMIANELQLNILRSITLTGAQNAIALDQLVLPFVLLRHRQRFPTGASQAFEQLLMRQS